MMWFTSDEHYGHENIIRHCARPFANHDEMEGELIARHNTVVARKDVVYHLGDFSLRTGTEYLTRLLSRLNGRHILVAGNHDKCHAIHRRGDDEVRRYKSAGFIAVMDRAIVPLGPVLGRALLSHLPPSSLPRERDPLSQWRPTASERAEAGNGIHLHGHVHLGWRRKGNLVNVGVDVWDFAPVSVEQIEALVYEPMSFDNAYIAT